MSRPTELSAWTAEPRLARSWLIARDVKKRSRLIAIGLGAVLVALVPALVDSPLTTHPAASRTPDRPVVRVEHELVAATVVEAEMPRRVSMPRGRPLARRHTRPAGIMSRARQLIVGNGRYRPEPFPRAAQ